MSEWASALLAGTTGVGLTLDVVATDRPASAGITGWLTMMPSRSVVHPRVGGHHKKTSCTDTANFGSHHRGGTPSTARYGISSGSWFPPTAESSVADRGRADSVSVVTADTGAQVPSIKEPYMTHQALMSCSIWATQSAAAVERKQVVMPVWPR